MTSSPVVRAEVHPQSAPLGDREQQADQGRRQPQRPHGVEPAAGAER
ncbi:hypothetical protein ACVWXU_006130 [Streptomyces sp. TE33382]